MSGVVISRVISSLPVGTLYEVEGGMHRREILLNDSGKKVSRAYTPHGSFDTLLTDKRILDIVIFP